MLRTASAVLLGIAILLLGTDALAQKKNATKAKGELEKGEKYLFGEGVRKSVRRALTCFKNARKLLPEGPVHEHLDARIAIGLAQAYTDLRKHKEAAAELNPLAEGFADRNVRWKGAVFGSGPTVEWTKALKECKAGIEAGGDLKALEAKLHELAVEARKNKSGERYAQVAEYLLGTLAEKNRKFKEAADYYRPLARAQTDHLVRTGAQLAKQEAGRSKTPANIPPAEKPPGKLDGKYEKTVMKGLDWMVGFQTKDGDWSETALEALSKDDPMPPGRTKVYPSKLTTAMAVMAFLRAGVKLADGDRGEALKKGLDWILKHQSGNGKIPPNTKSDMIMVHGAYTWTLAEAVCLLEDPEPYREPLKKAVAFLLEAQNPGLGWRHGIKPRDNDTEHTAQAMIALARAHAAGVEVPFEAFAGGLEWFGKITDPVTGRAGFTSRGDSGVMRADAMKFKPVDTSTAMTLGARILLGEDSKKGLLGRGFDSLWGRPPGWVKDRDIHLKYSHYYTLAYGLRPGADANYNLKRMADLLVKNQESEKSAEGSWPPIGALSSDGRILATARAILSIVNARGVNLPEPIKGDKE